MNSSDWGVFGHPRLVHLHSYGVIHGDVKPQNILIGEDGRSRLADFDLSADTATRTSKSFPTQLLGLMACS